MAYIVIVLGLFGIALTLRSWREKRRIERIIDRRARGLVGQP